MKKLIVNTKTVGTSLTKILSANPKRRNGYAFVQNKSDNTVYIQMPDWIHPVVLKPEHIFMLPKHYTGKCSANTKDHKANLTIVEVTS